MKVIKLKKLLNNIKKSHRRFRSDFTQHPHFHANRLKIVAFGAYSIFFVLALRAITIQLLPPSEEILAKLAKNQYQKNITSIPYRGAIYDRRGEPLAISTKKQSFFINPRVFAPTSAQAQLIRRTLGISNKDFDKIRKRKGYFAWLKRKVPANISSKLSKIQVKGLHSLSEPARFYPAGEIASHIIGAVGLDNNGLMGLESHFDELLSGNHKQAARSRDARGRTIHTSSAFPEQSGNRITLTIDRVIQEISERALKEGIKASAAKSGFVIVSDPHTGRLLALANYPSFDPNFISKSSIKNTRNHALLDLYEPGSVVKPFIIGKALSKKLTTLDAVYDTFNGVYRENRWRIRDSHPEETMTTEEILIHSSNIGTYQIAKKLGMQETFSAYIDFGIGSQDNQLPISHQNYGRISDWNHWRSIRFANISFGQGLLVTGLEIAQAFGVIANGGNLMKPILVDRIEGPDGELIKSYQPQIVRRVLPTRTAKDLRQTLEKVVKQGTGRNAQLSLYSSAGKSGTSEKVDPKTKSYAADLRIASFAGFAPVEDPYLVIYVVVDEPGNKPYYGGKWAAPIFKNIAEQSLRYLNVAPDLKAQEAISIREQDEPKAQKVRQL